MARLNYKLRLVRLPLAFTLALRRRHRSRGDGGYAPPPLTPGREAASFRFHYYAEEYVGRGRYVFSRYASQHVARFRPALPGRRDFASIKHHL